jgi:hypothetical protein
MDIRVRDKLGGTRLRSGDVDSGYLLQERGRCEVYLLGLLRLIYTVNKLRSLNLLFSCMFRIENKIVHVGMEKIDTLY